MGAGDGAVGATVAAGGAACVSDGAGSADGGAEVSGGTAGTGAGGVTAKVVVAMAASASALNPAATR